MQIKTVRQVPDEISYQNDKGMASSTQSDEFSTMVTTQKPPEEDIVNDGKPDSGMETVNT